MAKEQASLTEQKLTEEEVTALDALMADQKVLDEELLRAAKLGLNLKLKNKAIEDFANKLAEKETELAKQLQEAYGIGEVNLETKTFIPRPSQETA